MKPAALVHIADVHLGNGDAGADGGTDSAEARALSGAIDLAVEEDVDAVLVAGDLFDHPRVPDELLAWTAAELDRAGRPVVLLVGNHDPLDAGSVHHRFRPPDSVTLLDDPDGATVDVPGTEFTVWGRAMVEHAPRYRPLAGVPPRPEGRWSVAAGHGLVLARDRPSHHSSPIRPADIEAVDWDYVALGHHHAFRVVREAPRPVVYPGATAYSRHGVAGAVLVRFEPGTGASVRWVPLDLSLVAG